MWQVYARILPAGLTGPRTLPKPTNLVSKPPILMESRCGRFTHESYRQAYIGHLRQKLERDPAQPCHLLTESGVGYRLMPDA